MKRIVDCLFVVGCMKILEVVLVVGFMSFFGISLLVLFNFWIVFFGIFVLVSYVFVYILMKCVFLGVVVIGVIFGVLLILIGCVVVQGELIWFGLMFFVIQFCWQFFYFWFIVYLGYEDYFNAGYKFVFEVEGGIDLKKLGCQVLVYVGVLILLVILFVYLGVIGWILVSIVVVFGVVYSYFVWQFL